MEQKDKILISIGTDLSIFEEGSDVRRRQILYAKDWKEVHIIVFSPAKDDYKDIKICDNCYLYPTKSFIKIFAIYQAFIIGLNISRKKKINNITCQDPFFTSISAILLKNKLGSELEIQIHTDIGSPSFSEEFGNKIRKYISKWSLKKANTIRVVSSRIRDFLVSSMHISINNIYIKPIFVDKQEIANTPISTDLHKKYPLFHRIVLMASRLEPEKNIEIVIYAWREILKRRNDILLLIVGSGSQKEYLHGIVNKYGLQPNIIFEPWVDKKTLISYYKSADLFLQTSKYEGYGMSLVEAMSAGCKVLSTDVGVAKEIGATITGLDIEELSDNIVYLI
jgi:glycosyltransferase involved in cell wall biosynthesis